MVAGAVVGIGKQRLGVGVGVDTAASGMCKRRLVVGGGGVATTGTASGKQRLGVDPGAAQVGNDCTGSLG